MSCNAWIWSIYLDKVANFDANMLAEWRDTIDILLVFAGLFSAVLTTFVVQTSQNMQPDYNKASACLLFEILKVTMSNGSQSSIPSSPTALLRFHHFFSFSPFLFFFLHIHDYSFLTSDFYHTFSAWFILLLAHPSCI
ncbi:uncharacterized protein EV420DRAFT_1318713 [Desarmillaria tabescens]|uniref:DUF6535 domain-containing protein n=1 Tax=Armillaria tabescens TaxID=1929756 RepID=A0AA39J1R8_ARMTA|nr:uncharacterized protein EV420DRAFT_1318713 [Desarmillaria tabescens]KAK0433904.1 hypothetical protein EV420DRAFT_1318713 [Desarmillaria tabescens]